MLIYQNLEGFRNRSPFGFLYSYLSTAGTRWVLHIKRITMLCPKALPVFWYDLIHPNTCNIPGNWLIPIGFTSCWFISGLKNLHSLAYFFNTGMEGQTSSTRRWNKMWCAKENFFTLFFCTALRSIPGPYPPTRDQTHWPAHWELGSLNHWSSSDISKKKKKKHTLLQSIGSPTSISILLLKNLGQLLQSKLKMNQNCYLKVFK